MAAHRRSPNRRAGASARSDAGRSDPDQSDPERVAAGLAALRERVVAAEIGREGLRRAARLAHDAAVETGLDDAFRRPPPRLAYPRFGWREAARRAVEHRMLTPHHTLAALRWTAQRARAAARGEDLDLQGMVFTGRDVHLHATAGHGRLVVGPWCWIGDHARVRAHEGRVQLGAKVVLGAGARLNGWLDVLVGDAVLVADDVHVYDFDHQFDRLDRPIKDQGIAMSPVRIGADTWLGDRVTVLRGVDVGVGSVVGARSVVSTDLPPFAIANGIPARPVRSRLPRGVDPEEAAALLARGLPIPGDPLED